MWLALEYTAAKIYNNEGKTKAESEIGLKVS